MNNDIITTNPETSLFKKKNKRIISRLLVKELIKVKSEVFKLLIFHSGMGFSEFNYPDIEVLPNI